ncbi:MAG TPA: oligosaccharide flippase family protein, partial [Anaeromyxobacter sp.]
LADSILTRARPLMLARLAGAALTFVVPVVLARVLVPAAYGTFKQAWLVSQTLALVLPLGLTQSLYYFVPREPALRDRFVAQTLWAMTVLGGVAAALLLALGPVIAARFDNPELAANLPWIATFTALLLAGAPLDIAWNASGRVGSAAVARVLTEAARGAGMVVGALATRSVEGVLAGIAAASAARAIVTWVLLARRHGLRGDLAALRRQYSYALPFGLAFLVLIPQQQYHQYAVAAAIPAAAFAVYSVGVFQLPLVDVLYTPVSELLQIGLAEAERDGRGPGAELALFHEAVAQLAFAFVPLLGLLVVVAPDLITFVFSERYAAATPIFRVSALSVALAALPLDGVLRARAQNRFMLVLSGAKLGVTVPLVSAGLAWLGPIGALGGWIAAEALARAAMLARVAQLFRARAREVLPLRPLARQAVATLAAMPAAWLGLHAAEAAFFRLAAAGLAFAAAYLGVTWAKGWLPAGWASLFRRRLPRAAAAGES